MPRLMSVAHTEAQVRDRSKTVTRRVGWRHARAGQELWLVRKAMGLKKGEQVERICKVLITDVRTERLDEITAEDVAAEGFPEWTPAEFVEFFTATMSAHDGTLVTRIEWEYLDA